MELAVELSSSQLVQVLLEAGASVIPIEGARHHFSLLSYIDTGQLYSRS